MEHSDSHEALIQNSRGSALVVGSRATPKPGPNQVVVKVKAIALNPVDNGQKKIGFHVSSYPAVLGFDVSGTIHSVGSSVSNLAVGDRVLCLASSWFDKLPEFGAFQQLVLVPAEQVALLPKDIPFNEACVLPLALFTAWYSFVNIELPPTTGSVDKGILIWGVGGSVGSVTLQIAKIMGFHVYATASQKHHSYLNGLGKGPGKVKLFDYKDKDVNQKIIQAAKEDNVAVNIGIEAASGNLADIVYILNNLKETSQVAKISVAPFSLSFLWYRFAPSFLTGAVVKFVNGPEEKNRFKELSEIFNWLASKLKTSELVPSPKSKVIPGGLLELRMG